MARTQVAIIGAGPSGLLLSQLLDLAGIDNVVLERRTRQYVESRIRAGVLEQGTADLLTRAGVDARMKREGIVHDHIGLAFGEREERIDLTAHTGASVIIYGQTEIQHDLFEARAARGGTIVFEAEDVTPLDFDTAAPRVTYRKDGLTHTLDCDVIAGCDGYHGVCRASVPESALKTYELVYPFGWLGVLADPPPVSPHAVTYVSNDRGFALCSMRSMSRSRYYIQCALEDDVAQWSDAAFWDELRRRLPSSLAEPLVTGASIEKSIAPLRSFVAEPMRFGALFLAGDSAHIVPPTGAKGLNLAAADVRVLADALAQFYGEKDSAGLAAYSDRCLRRVWRAERFSWQLTMLTHKFSDDDFNRRMQVAELDYLTSSEAGAKSVAENYTGVALEAAEG